MIAGETESIIRLNEDSFYEYDELFGLGGKGKARRQAKRVQKGPPKTRAEKQEGRKRFFQGIGSKIKENGGLQGVSSTLGNVLGMFKSSNEATDGPADYQLAVGDNTQPVEKDKKLTLGMYVVGGAVVVGLMVFGVTQLSKNKASQ